VTVADQFLILQVLTISSDVIEILKDRSRGASIVVRRTVDNLNPVSYVGKQNMHHGVA
jgi:hypothetical protein